MIGMVSIAGARLVAKSFSMVAQLFLGWILSKGDYKLWAMVSVALIFVSGLRDGGVQRLIVHQGRNSPENIRSIGHFCWILHIFAGLLLFVCSPVAAAYFRNPKVAPLIALMAVVVPSYAPLIIGYGRMTLAMRFKEIALFDAIMSFSRYSSMIIFAWLGFGAFSFVLPEIVVNIVGGTLFIRATGEVEAGASLTQRRLMEIWSESKWLIFATFSAAFAMNGDYMVLGRVEPSVLADYFFGFQLSLSISVLFTPAIQVVLLPTFNRLNDQPNRQAAAYLKSIRIAALIACPLCVAMLVMAPPFIRIAWAGKWDAAIPVVQIMSINLMFRLLSPLAFSMLQAHGKWKTYGLMLFCEGIAVVAGTVLGVGFGGLVAIAAAIGLFRCLLPPVAMCVAGKLVDIPPRDILLSLGRPFVVYLLAAITLTFLFHAFPSQSDFTDVAARLSLVSIVVALITVLMFKSDVQDAFRQIRSGSHAN